jgi:hypothetical protein
MTSGPQHGTMSVISRRIARRVAGLFKPNADLRSPLRAGVGTICCIARPRIKESFEGQLPKRLMHSCPRLDVRDHDAHQLFVRGLARRTQAPHPAQTTTEVVEHPKFALKGYRSGDR